MVAKAYDKAHTCSKAYYYIKTHDSICCKVSNTQPDWAAKKQVRKHSLTYVYTYRIAQGVSNRRPRFQDLKISLRS